MLETDQNDVDLKDIYAVSPEAAFLQDNELDPTLFDEMNKVDVTSRYNQEILDVYDQYPTETVRQVVAPEVISTPEMVRTAITDYGERLGYERPILLAVPPVERQIIKKKSLLEKTLGLITGDSNSSRAVQKARTERDMIELESAIGREIFGPVPADHRREFFCLDPHTWIWYEQWTDDASGKTKAMTTRYEVHENGILKVQDGSMYRFIEGDELKNLGYSTRQYYERSMREIYKKDPYTGQTITEAPATIE